MREDFTSIQFIAYGKELQRKRINHKMYNDIIRKETNKQTNKSSLERVRHVSVSKKQTQLKT